MRRSFRALSGLVLVLALLAATLGTSAHSGPLCLVHKDCLACRFSADSIVVPAAPPSLPRLEWVATVPTAADEASAPSPLSLASSRAPPLG